MVVWSKQVGRTKIWFKKEKMQIKIGQMTDYVCFKIRQNKTFKTLYYNGGQDNWSWVNNYIEITIFLVLL